ncbi:MAG TPA: lamin tail domain-containing protein, partial [Pyrinomonadaceae bacterium]
SVTSAPASINVEPPPAVPAAGQVIVNEALVSFAGSTTQTRADFVELHNTTDRTLDISGLVVSFRASGTSNTPRAVSLPGAVGSRTTLVQPRGYFLIANGATTFGAAADFAVPGDGFNLNNTTGGIKIEVGGVKLDGLAYQQEGAAAVSDVFRAYGEGPIFAHTGTSSSTNDFVRRPNAADTNNNLTDFTRNSTAASVTPKAANP